MSAFDPKRTSEPFNYKAAVRRRYLKSTFFLLFQEFELAPQPACCRRLNQDCHQDRDKGHRRDHLRPWRLNREQDAGTERQHCSLANAPPISSVRLSPRGHALFTCVGSLPLEQAMPLLQEVAKAHQNRTMKWSVLGS
jgi:hypothetical protein